MSVDYRPDYDPADVDSDYGHTGGDITVPTFTGDTRPFRFWCQKALPLVYDDSLSYYEVLCKMADYMNNFMTDLTTVEDSMTEFGQQFVINQQFLNDMADQLGQNVADLEAYINDRMDDFMTAYTQLQTYVNNYFDNLDVQEEINTKLDTMASDGTLNDLFDPVLATWMQQKTAQIDAAIANQDAIQAAQNGRISVLEGRMDTFDSLPSGSTSGNAELLGIRTNFLGETYPTAGDAVRASDMIASGFLSIPFTRLEEWNGNAESSVYDTLQIDVSAYKGGHVIMIANMESFQSYVQNLGGSVFATNVSGKTADANAHEYVLGSSVFPDFTVIPTQIQGEERDALYFSIPDNFAYQYLKMGVVEHNSSGEHTQPAAIVYANSWSKTPVDPTLTIAGDAADAKATGDAIDELNERLEDDIVILNNGGFRIPAEFEIGSISNGENVDFQAGVRTVSILPITKETIIRADSGYRYLVAYYTSNGTFISQSSLTTDITVISENSYIRIVIRALPDQTLPVGTDPDIFAKHVTFYNEVMMSVYNTNQIVDGHTDFIDGKLKGEGILTPAHIENMTMNTSGTIYPSSGNSVAWAKVYKGMVLTFFSDNNGTWEPTNCRYGFYATQPKDGSTTSNYRNGYTATITSDCYIAFTRPGKTLFRATFINQTADIYKTEKMDTDIYGNTGTLSLSMLPNTAISNANGTFFSQEGWTAGTTPVKAGTNLDFKADGVVTNCRWTLFDGNVNNSNIYAFGTGYGTSVPDDKDYNIMISAHADVTQFTIESKKIGIKTKAEGAWNGKKIVWFGTSIPAGVVVAGGSGGIGSYPERIGRLLGATVYNEAVGSSRARGGSYKVASENDPLGWAGMSPLGILLSLSLSSTEKQGFVDDWNSKWSQIVSDPAGTMTNITEARLTLYKNTSWDIKLAKYLTGGSVGPCDLYVFDHGFNEAVATYQFDEMSDEPPANDPTNRAYFLGAMGFLFTKILNDNPNAKIIVIGHYMNAPKQGTTGQYLIKNGVDKCCSGQVKVASDWGIPIIKTWEYMGISNHIITVDGNDIPVLFAKFPDGTHPASDTTGKALENYANVLYPLIKEIG